MVHTHDVTVLGDVVRKVYVSWDEGEPEREWAALQLLAREAPGPSPYPCRKILASGATTRVAIARPRPARPRTRTMRASTIVTSGRMGRQKTHDISSAVTAIALEPCSSDYWWTGVGGHE